MRGFSPLLFRLYASDLSDAIYALSRERQMADERIVRRVIGSTQYVSLGGKTVAVSPMASDQEIATALGIPAESAPTPLPAVQIAPSAPVVAKSATTGMTGATHAGMSIKQMMADRKQKLGAAHDKVVANFGKLDQATAALDAFGDDLGNEADDLLASIGQFKNDLGADQ
jgi:hypothetical protein